MCNRVNFVIILGVSINKWLLWINSNKVLLKVIRNSIIIIGIEYKKWVSVFGSVFQWEIVFTILVFIKNLIKFGFCECIIIYINIIILM